MTRRMTHIINTKMPQMIVSKCKQWFVVRFYLRITTVRLDVIYGINPAMYRVQIPNLLRSSLQQQYTTFYVQHCQHHHSALLIAPCAHSSRKLEAAPPTLSPPAAASSTYRAVWSVEHQHCQKARPSTRTRTNACSASVAAKGKIKTDLDQIESNRIESSRVDLIHCKTHPINRCTQKAKDFNSGTPDSRSVIELHRVLQLDGQVEPHREEDTLVRSLRA